MFSRWSLGLDSDIYTLLWSHHRVAFSLPKHPYLKIVVTYRNQNVLCSWISIFTEHTILAFTIYNILLWDMSFMCAIWSLGPPSFLSFMDYSRCPRTSCPLGKGGVPHPTVLAAYPILSVLTGCPPHLSHSQVTLNGIISTQELQQKTDTCELLPKPDDFSGVHLWACHQCTDLTTYVSVPLHSKLPNQDCAICICG